MLGQGMGQTVKGFPYYPNDFMQIIPKHGHQPKFEVLPMPDMNDKHCFDRLVEHFQSKLDSVVNKSECLVKRLTNTMDNLACQMKNAANTMGSLAPDKFTGKITEDYTIFLARLNCYFDSLELSDMQKVTRFPLFLHDVPFGHFMSAPDSDKTTWAEIQTWFKKQYGNRANKVVWKNELEKIKLQHTGESLTKSLIEYAEKVRILGRKLELDTDSLLHAFLKGLPPNMAKAITPLMPDSMQNALERTILYIEVGGSLEVNSCDSHELCHQAFSPFQQNVMENKDGKIAQMGIEFKNNLGNTSLRPECVDFQKQSVNGSKLQVGLISDQTSCNQNDSNHDYYDLSILSSPNCENVKRIKNYSNMNKTTNFFICWFCGGRNHLSRNCRLRQKAIQQGNNYIRQIAQKGGVKYTSGIYNHSSKRY